VNGLDLAIWKNGFGATGTAALKSAGNADGDGDVDGRDFLIWQRGNSPTATAAVASIPEPTSLAMFGFASLFAMWRWRPCDEARIIRRTA
jgi:hypothetical protein